METGDSIDKIEVDQSMNKIIEEEALEVIQEHTKILKDKIVKVSTEIIIEMKVMAEVETGTGLERDHFLETEEMTEVQVIVDPGQDQGQVQIETCT